MKRLIMTRREFMKLLGFTAGSAALAGKAPAIAHAVGAPERGVTGTPDEMVLVYWTVDGDEPAVLEIMDVWRGNTGVPVRWERTPNIEETFQRVLSMFVAGDQVDVTVMNNFNTARWVEEGVVQPLDGLPGLENYLADMLPAARSLATYKGQVWGLPYFLSLNTNVYNTRVFERAGLTALPRSFEELGEVCIKMKADGIAQYPIVWQAGTGPEHVSDTWYHLIGAERGRLFDDNLNILLDGNSVARRTLRWWRDTMQRWQIADPASVELRWIPAIRAYAAGNHFYTNSRERYMNDANDPSRSPSAGQHRIFQIGTQTFSGNLWSMPSNAFDRDYSWRFLQYFGGHTSDGRFIMADGRARYALASGWPQHSMRNPEIRALWDRMFNTLEEYERQFATATYIGDIVPALNTTWYTDWVVREVVPNLQSCLTGSISADTAADRIAASVSRYKT